MLSKNFISFDVIYIDFFKQGEETTTLEIRMVGEFGKDGACRNGAEVVGNSQHPVTWPGGGDMDRGATSLRHTYVKYFLSCMSFFPIKIKRG